MTTFTTRKARLIAFFVNFRRLGQGLHFGMISLKTGCIKMFVKYFKNTMLKVYFIYLENPLHDTPYFPMMLNTKYNHYHYFSRLFEII